MNVTIEKLVMGGQGMGALADGRKVFVWGALPGETVEIDITREKTSYAEAVVTKVITSSSERVTVLEPWYLSTSPWQMLSETAERRFKKDMLVEQFKRAHLAVAVQEMVAAPPSYAYRNKVEFGFVEVDGVLHLAVSGRRSHEKISVDGNALARSELNAAAHDVLDMLRMLNIPAQDLSHLTLRCSQDGVVAGNLVVKTPRFPELQLPESMVGLQVRFVDGFGRKHRTKVLQVIGESRLTDTLCGVPISYAATSFFQVNVPVYEKTLEDIREAVRARDVVELYAGVGSIGLTCGAKQVTLVDIDPLNTGYAEENVRRSGVKGTVVTSSSEKALDYVHSESVLVLDPPRAGLSPQVVSRITRVQPPTVIYLSCDPATLVRDLVRLQKFYDITVVKPYNFFPRTPHIETLVVLNAKAV